MKTMMTSNENTDNLIRFTEIELISLVDQGLAELDNRPELVLEFLEDFAIEKE